MLATLLRPLLRLLIIASVVRPQGMVQLGRHLLASASGDALAPLEAALAQLSSAAPIADDKVRAWVVPLLSIALLAHPLATHRCQQTLHAAVKTAARPEARAQRTRRHEVSGKRFACSSLSHGGGCK